MCLERPAISAAMPALASAARSVFCARDETLAVGTAVVEQARDALVGFRLQMAEGEIFQFPLQLPDAEPVRQRRVDVDRELRQLAAPVGCERVGRAHAHKLAREQDEDHTQVADDREQQAAQSFRAARGRARRMQGPDFLRRLLTLDQSVHARRGVHDGIDLRGKAGLARGVQDAGDEGVRIRAQLREQIEGCE